MKPLFICLLVAATAVSSAWSRTWTEAASGRALEGDFLRIEGDQVLVIKANGSVVKLKTAILSEADQEFLTEAKTKADAEAAKRAAADSAVFKWETEFEHALERAKTESKPLLLDFTGSDWCPPCKALKSTIFEDRKFKEFAAESLVLVELDFPRGKSLPKSEAKQNDELKSKYGITGFPTVIILDSSGKEIDRRVGFGGGSPADYVDGLKAVIAR